MTQTADRTDQFPALARLLDERWTCRQFLPDQVPQETIETLLNLAQRTPSWCNTQPWQVELTAGAATDRFRSELLDHIRSAPLTPDLPFPAAYTGAYQQRRRECGFQLYDSVGIVKGDHAATMRQSIRNFELFDAPHVAIITTEADLGTYGAVDCGLYINTFLLGAQSLGLAAAPQAALASHSKFLHTYFDLPDNRQVVAGISFGYADLAHPINSFRTRRATVDQVVNWHNE
ncbi:nitroreductase family protein [Antrihabitans sp. YC2-6]|uniref:nitroreductase family protein n=1 Tax=Antrihabitans sp. YC2-6 TaxID=2799498 RepID=UPI0018F5434A|nr:nitroreductase family protein [Antrihabitans sp. YC2-6]MBJ8345523.1 nitroreductase family protein [Antrihabitans sp. YC2-6]